MMIGALGRQRTNNPKDTTFTGSRTTVSFYGDQHFTARKSMNSSRTARFANTDAADEPPAATAAAAAAANAAAADKLV
jgi:hypothetical protein